MKILSLLPVLLGLSLSAIAQPPPAKRLPPAGVAIPEKDRTELTAGAAALGSEIEKLRADLKSKPDLLALLPDVEVFHKAVDWALRYDEFFNVKQVATARDALKQGTERAQALRSGKAPWTEATGLIVRGYRSKIDGSVQPYGLTVPPTWKKDDGKARRLDLWLLGRGENRTELAFIAERAKPSMFEAEDTIVLTPYGRFCNATKFAGEVDVFEAMEAVKRQFKIDLGRVVVRGFSMGGASTWHLATHHPDVWCAAAPGAGFVETPNYAKVFAPGKDFRPWWEQILWRWYNSTDYAGNLFNVPTVAYSGELDAQKAAADTIVAAAAAEGVTIEHIIGPKTEHKYEPEAKKVVAAKVDALAAKGRDATPKQIHFTTYTLRYPECAWLRIEGLEKHWERADVRATLETGSAKIATRNVSALSLSPVGNVQINGQNVAIDGQTIRRRIRVISGRRDEPDRLVLVKENGEWRVGEPASTTRKVPGIQGPINDAFMDRFVFVRPTGKPLNGTVGGWVQGELAHATKMWRDIFRGEAPVKDDSAITRDDMTDANLVLWGDPSSNSVLAKLLPGLPLKWDAKMIEFRGYKLDAAHHAPILIFPNPLNPTRYVVINSGIDFREEAYGTNSLQTPKLPDWAIIDLRTPPDRRWPGLVYDAGFFDERWQ